MNIERITLNQTPSTNTFLASLPLGNENTIRVVTARYQRAGRGQGTNSWESEDGKNLLFSFDVTRPNLSINKQFYLSMVCALAVKQTLNTYINDITLKWPNDIYWKNKKICGILIELNVDKQGIKRCIFGVGININQALFTSNAPNPVSLFQIIKQETNPEEVLYAFLNTFVSLYNTLQTGNTSYIYNRYKDALYRRKGYYTYQDKHGFFKATIKDVLPNGTLLLTTEQGQERQYAFKEVSFILPLQQH